LESVTFPVAHCSDCARDVLVASDLDEQDRWIRVCTLCSAELPGPGTRQYSAESLRVLGYDVEGSSLGCGGGGQSCGTCGSAA